MGRGSNRRPDRYSAQNSAPKAWVRFPTTMKLLLTGAGGTLGRAVVAAARSQGHQVLPWPRAVLNPLEPAAHAEWIAAQSPEAILHLAVASESTGAPDEGRRVNVEWGCSLAETASRLGLPLVFSSTAMVYDAEADGPYTLASPPTPRNDYGAQKLQAEHGMLLRHPSGVRIARLGWQIDPQRRDGNQMVAHAHREQLAQGHVNASRQWRPACSFIDDTARALLGLLTQPAGVYLFDSNAEGVSFDRLLQALSDAHGFGWQVHPHDDYRHDQRMIDPRPGLPPLSARLPALKPSPARG